MKRSAPLAAIFLLACGLGAAAQAPAHSAAPRMRKASARERRAPRQAARGQAPAQPRSSAPYLERDPFKALIQPEPQGKGKAAAPPRAPGLAGIGVDELTVQGVATGGPTGPVALISSPDNRTYFLRPGDRVMDGQVIRIDPNGIWFQRWGSSGSTQVYRRVG
jgi:hypothetical protein